MTLTLLKDPVRGATTEGNAADLCCVTSYACANAQGLPDDCVELETLRSFRDGYMKSLPEGPALIADYYAASPRIVAAIEASPNPSAIYQRIYQEDILPCVQLIQEGQMEAALYRYKEIMAKLKATYLGE